MSRNITPKDPASIAEQQAPDNLFRAIKELRFEPPKPHSNHAQVVCIFDPARLTAEQRESPANLEPVARKLFEAVDAKVGDAKGPTWGRDHQTNEYFASVTIIDHHHTKALAELREQLESGRFKLGR